MRFGEILKSSFTTMKHNKRRTFLTMIGIIVGVGAVVAILSLGNGYRKATMDNLTKDDKGRLSQNFNFNLKDYEAFFSLARHQEPFSQELVDSVGKIPGVDEAVVQSPWGGRDNTFYPDVKVGRTRVNWADVYYEEETNEQMLIGRNLTLEDSEAAKRYVIISTNQLHELFDGYELHEVINQTVQMNDNLYTVIGIFQSVMPNFDEMEMPVDEYIGPPRNYIIPAGTYRQLEQDEFMDFPQLRVFFEPSVQPGDDMKRLSKQIESYLNENGLDQEIGNYSFFDESKWMEQIGKQLQQTTVFITGIAAISLFIAGVGVMNMMYISVAERTKEIGIRRSMGATRRSIQWQFLLEGIAITTLGGIIGYGSGIGVAFAINKAGLMAFPPVVDIPTAAGAVVISILIGIVFSVFPARSAARKNVVEILR